jgi:dienelactone hydrolase
MDNNRVLLLAGSPYEIGFQHGKMLKAEVRQIVKRVLTLVQQAEIAGVKGYSSGTLEQAWARTSQFIDKRYQEEMHGLADGADLDLNDVQLANVFPELFHCSGFALFKTATTDGRLLHGRILDYMTEVGLQNCAVIIVTQPDNYNAFVNVGYAGLIGSVTGMNDRQISIGEMGGDGQGKWDGVPMSFLIRKTLEEANSLSQAVEIFRVMPRTCEYYYVISDGKIPDARGLACTPNDFQTLLPGKAYERLPIAVDNAVLMSGGQRYEYLAAQVQQHLGKIDANEALCLMNRPIAMESCLHRVLFAPQTFEFWVANAADMNEPNYAACYQPFYKYNFRELLDRIPKTAPADAAPISKPRTDSNAVAEGEQKKQEKCVITGTVSASVVRSGLESSNPDEQNLLSRYSRPAASFPYRMELVSRTKSCELYNVSFPSEYKSKVNSNNRVYCEYYHSRGEAKRPAVIILDILNGSMIISRLIAQNLADSGIDGCVMVLPYYGPRKAEKSSDIAETPETFLEAVQQSVIDIRTTARWLANQSEIDEKRIGLCGTSLGGLIAALASGVDGQFDRVALLLAGGDIATVITSDAAEVQKLKHKFMETGVTRNQLEEILKPIEPLSFADRLNNTKILMINGKQDAIVPPSCAQKFADKVNAKIVWYDTDHYGMIKYIFVVLNEINQHFRNPENSATASMPKEPEVLSAAIYK